MPAEWVLLSNEVPSTEVISQLGEARHRGGAVIETQAYRQFVDGDGRGVVAFWGSRQMHVTTHAEQLVSGGVDGYFLWTDVTAPYGDDADGRALADAVAESIGGVVRERT
jgi:hypothetical protein